MALLSPACFAFSWHSSHTYCYTMSELWETLILNIWDTICTSYSGSGYFHSLSWVRYFLTSPGIRHLFDSLGAALFLYLNIGVPLAACIHVYNKGTLAALKINMKSDMQKVETLLPADFQFKFPALLKNN